MGASESSIYLILLPALVGALVSQLGSFVISLFQHNRGHWNKKTELITEALVSAAELGTEYWIGSTTKYEELKMLECKIVGMQSRIDGLLVPFTRTCPVMDVEGIQSRQRKVHDALTGGSFQSAYEPNLQMALDVQTSTNDLIVFIQAVSTHVNSPFRSFKSLKYRSMRSAEWLICKISNAWSRRPLPRKLRAYLDKIGVR